MSKISLIYLLKRFLKIPFKNRGKKPELHACEDKFKNPVLSDYHPGDIIIANRYITTSQKKKIPKNHERGPFIVIQNNHTSLEAIYCTGVNLIENANNHNENKDFYMKLTHPSLTKKTFLDLTCIHTIKENRQIRFIGTIYKTQLETIFSQIHHLKIQEKFIENLYQNILIPKPQEENIGNCSLLSPVPVKKQVQNGSVIYQENYYYVYGTEAKKLLCFKLQPEYRLKNNTIFCDHIPFRPLFLEKREINMSEPMSLIAQTTDKEMDFIRLLKKANQLKGKQLTPIDQRMLVNWQQKEYQETLHNQTLYHLIEERDIINIRLNSGERKNIIVITKNGLQVFAYMNETNEFRTIELNNSIQKIGKISEEEYERILMLEDSQSTNHQFFHKLMKKI